MLDVAINGFLSALAPSCILLTGAGVFLGIIFGSIPGLTAGMAMVLCLPLSFAMTPLNGTALLCGLFIGGISGGLMSAILLKIPGTPASVATVFDGYPMAMKGEAHKALGVGILFSFFGTIFGLIVLIFCAPPLAEFALTFSPFEYFSITFFALTLISALSTGSVVKGLLSGCVGVMFSLVGLSPVGGVPRFTMGFQELNAGFEMVPFLLGLFAISEMLHNCAHGFPDTRFTSSAVKMKGFGISFKEAWAQKKNFTISSLLGNFIGILPGIGASTAGLVAYITAKKMSKTPEKFGTGIIDGIVASESANNACIGGALVPLLALGIPGDSAAAILLGGLMMHNLQPGPLMFITNGDLVYGVFGAMLVAACCMLCFEYFMIPLFARLLRIPKSMLMPLVVVMCLVGGFGVNNRIFDSISVLVFGLIGFAFLSFKFPLAPMVLGFILGHLVEMNFSRALMLSKGSYLPFMTRPISAFFLVLAVFFIAYPYLKKYIFKDTSAPIP